MISQHGLLKERVSEPLRNENGLLPSATRIPQRQLAVADVAGCKFSDLADPHLTSRHQFQHYPVSGL